MRKHKGSRAGDPSRSGASTHENEVTPWLDRRRGLVTLLPIVTSINLLIRYVLYPSETGKKIHLISIRTTRSHAAASSGFLHSSPRPVERLADRKCLRASAWADASNALSLVFKSLLTQSSLFYDASDKNFSNPGVSRVNSTKIGVGCISSPGEGTTRKEAGLWAPSSPLFAWRSCCIYVECRVELRAFAGLHTSPVSYFIPASRTCCHSRFSEPAAPWAINSMENRAHEGPFCHGILLSLIAGNIYPPLGICSLALRRRARFPRVYGCTAPSRRLSRTYHLQVKSPERSTVKTWYDCKTRAVRDLQLENSTCVTHISTKLCTRQHEQRLAPQ